jgi:hypothetical protein
MTQQFQALRQAAEDLALVVPYSPESALILVSVAHAIADALACQARTKPGTRRQPRESTHKPR